MSPERGRADELANPCWQRRAARRYVHGRLRLSRGETGHRWSVGRTSRRHCWLQHLRSRRRYGDSRRKALFALNLLDGNRPTLGNRSRFHLGSAPRVSQAFQTFVEPSDYGPRLGQRPGMSLEGCPPGLLMGASPYALRSGEARHHVGRIRRGDRDRSLRVLCLAHFHPFRHDGAEVRPPPGSCATDPAPEMPCDRSGGWLRGSVSDFRSGRARGRHVHDTDRLPRHH
jgi:hypothetical protein